ncbi:MAG TPA: hypothetical protein VN578_25015, partial [Candidatus Binatia bacterium]|nr:hypothetical protein [Candidatus Binatia bacterium]
GDLGSCSVATQNSGCAAFSLFPNTRYPIQNQPLLAKHFTGKLAVFQQADRVGVVRYASP